MRSANIKRREKIIKQLEVDIFPPAVTRNPSLKGCPLLADSPVSLLFPTILLVERRGGKELLRDIDTGLSVFNFHGQWIYEIKTPWAVNFRFSLYVKLKVIYPIFRDALFLLFDTYKTWAPPFLFPLPLPPFKRAYSNRMKWTQVENVPNSESL